MGNRGGGKCLAEQVYKALADEEDEGWRSIVVHVASRLTLGAVLAYTCATVSIIVARLLISARAEVGWDAIGLGTSSQDNNSAQLCMSLLLQRCCLSA